LSDNLNSARPSLSARQNFLVMTDSPWRDQTTGRADKLERLLRLSSGFGECCDAISQLKASTDRRGAMTTLEGVPISRLIDMRHKLTALIKQNLYGGGSKREGQAALIARNRLDDFVFQMTDNMVARGSVADLVPLKQAIIETHSCRD
jgi:hypothetical protein